MVTTTTNIEVQTEKPEVDPRFELDFNKQEWWNGRHVMTRWIKLRTPWFRFGIHSFPRDCGEDSPHNHAAGFWSLILLGWYEEWTWEGLPWLPDDGRGVAPHRDDLPEPTKRQVWSAGSLRWIPKGAAHVIRQAAPWTLTMVFGPGSEPGVVTMFGGWQRYFDPTPRYRRMVDAPSYWPPPEKVEPPPVQEEEALEEEEEPEPAPEPEPPPLTDEEFAEIIRVLDVKRS